MAYWRLEIDLKSVFVPWSEEGFNPGRLGEIRGTIADTLLHSDWIFFTEDPIMFRDLTREIRYAESMEAFTCLWDAVYDLADIERVWISTT